MVDLLSRISKILDSTERILDERHRQLDRQGEPLQPLHELASSAAKRDVEQISELRGLINKLADAAEEASMEAYVLAHFCKQRKGTEHD